MRIIAGEARGRTIVAPKGQHTRPTQDYVRESLYNIIQRDIPGARVLDLFAGSGALALEALSRGAERAVLVDQSRKAVECIRRNVQTLGFSEQSAIVQGDWKSAAARLPAEPFDLIFLDPPYHLAKYREITDYLQTRRLIAQGALIVIEHRKDAAMDLSIDFTRKDVRTYGDTVIHFYRFDAGGNIDGK